MEWSVDERRRIYKRGLTIRAVLSLAFVVFFGGLGIAGYSTQVPGLPVLLAVLVLLLMINPILWQIGHRRRFALEDFRFHWAMDVLAVSAVVYAFGILDVPLTVSAYIIMIVSSATFASRQTAMSLAHWSSACLITIIGLEEIGWIEHQHVEFAAHLGMEGKVISVVGSVFLFHVFGYLAGEVATQLKEKAEEIDGQRDRVSKALERLQNANDRMVLLSTLVQHDVYGPLGVVSGAYKRAIAECRTGDAEKVSRYMELIGNSLQSIEGAVSTLSMLCREEDSFEATVDINEVAERARLDLESQARESGALVEIAGVTPRVRVREEELYHVIRNLLGNALRAVEEGGTGRVRISMSRRGNELEVQVTDNGCGFGTLQAEAPENDPIRGLPLRGQGGFGVGLSLVRNVVRGWGGAITRANVEGGGACVCFIVPSERVLWDGFEADPAVLGEEVPIKRA